MTSTATLLAASPLDIDELTLKRNGLLSKLTKLEEHDAEILTKTPDDQLEDEVSRADDYVERVQRTLLKIKRALDSAPAAVIVPTPVDPPAVVPPATDPPADPPAVVPPATDPPTDPLHPADPPADPLHPADPPADPRDPPVDPPTSRHMLYTKVKLPKITLPHFKGNPIYWTSFWDSYESAIHANPSLSDVDKFNYLKSLLEREAFDAIAGLTLSSANYQQAVAILKKRFGNRQVIVTRHMDILLNLTAITGDYDLRGMRRLYNEVETNIRSLTALGVKSETYGTMLTSVLLTKLPPEMRLLISRKSPRSELDLDTILVTLEEELIARERSGGRHRSSHERSREARFTPSATTLHSSTTSPSETSPAKCCYCEQSHSPDNCHVVKQIESRKQSLRSSGRCFNCLAKGHIVRRCRSRPQCTCGHKHHRSVCDSNSSNSNSSAEPAQKPPPPPTHHSNVAVSTLNPRAIPYVATTDVSALQSTTGSSILLQTAQAIVYNIKVPENRAKLRILLDGGSQRSYMTERARKMLRLDPEGQQRLSIASFGSNRGSPQVCPIVKVGVMFKRDPSLQISLFVVPMICEPLVCQPTDVCLSQNPEFSRLELADRTGPASQLQVDILVGADHYWEFVTGVVSKGSGGLTASTH